MRMYFRAIHVFQITVHMDNQGSHASWKVLDFLVSKRVGTLDNTRPFLRPAVLGQNYAYYSRDVMVTGEANSVFIH